MGGETMIEGIRMQELESKVAELTAAVGKLDAVCGFLLAAKAAESTRKAAHEAVPWGAGKPERWAEVKRLQAVADRAEELLEAAAQRVEHVVGVAVGAG